MAAARGSSKAPEPEPWSLSRSLGPAWVPRQRPWPVPGISSGIDGARSAGETLVEVAGVWELSWSGVLGARRRQQPWDVWTYGRHENCEWRPMSGQPIWDVRILLSAVCIVCCE